MICLCGGESTHIVLCQRIPTRWLHHSEMFSNFEYFPNWGTGNRTLLAEILHADQGFQTECLKSNLPTNWILVSAGNRRRRGVHRRFLGKSDTSSAPHAVAEGTTTFHSETNFLHDDQNVARRRSLARVRQGQRLP